MISLSALKSRYSSLSGNNSSLASSDLVFKLLLQIILLQVFYYTTAIVIFFLTSKLLGWGFHFSWVFSWTMVSIEHSLGLTLAFLWVLNALLSIIFITFIIGRSKMVWDFSFTVHFINFVIVWTVGGFPKNIYWWGLQFVSMILMVILGTYMTRWVELRDTFFENLNDIELGNK